MSDDAERAHAEAVARAARAFVAEPNCYCNRADARPLPQYANECRSCTAYKALLREVRALKSKP